MTDKHTPVSRRTFISSLAAAAGASLLPFGQKSDLIAGVLQHSSYAAQVAITEATAYGPALVKLKVQHLFETLGGLSDTIGTSDKVAIKINLTGGSSTQGHDRLKGADVRDTIWTHPDVLRAVCELLIDYGVSAENISVVEALWDDASYQNFGYKDIIDDLGISFVDLGKAAPYENFVEVSTGSDKFYYSSFVMNPILAEVDKYISIPKMKHHYSAAATHSIKNQIGTVPVEYYNKNGQTGHRASLHEDGGDTSTHLPKSIADLFLARPVDLAVNDGIKNAVNAEGPWVNGYQNAAYGMLLAGKDPVAHDAISTLLMGGDPEGDTLLLPNGKTCSNYLQMLADLGHGTNKISEIEIVGDGAGLLTGVGDDSDRRQPAGFSLSQNYPNPFNPDTSIRFSLGSAERVTITVTDIKGRTVGTLVERTFQAGSHELTWQADRFPSGIYFCRMQAGCFTKTVRMSLMK